MNMADGLLDPKQDFVFKNIFGKEGGKQSLISLLNSLFNNNPHIKELHLNNTDIAQILEEDKASRLDIKATSDNGTILDIEIQVKNTGEIPQRAFHYLANMTPHVVKTNESYKGPHVIGIWILGAEVTKRQNAISEAYMTFQPQDPDPYQIMTDSARIFFIELPKFNPKNADKRDLLAGWLSFLQNPVFMDTSYLEVQEIRNAMETLKSISADPETRALADIRQKTINDHNSEITVAREEAKAEGKAEGIEEGVAIGEERGELKGKRETALNAVTMGLSTEQIAKLTGLSIEEIESLKTR
ncbi:MAG: Rpn family recombination-promoting nuclease/putative transposase [Holosporaceae bacterium]|jgi:predicted transposase/invertase (TIGR01784 family)|nr:Rpn family recombination-promoting nuclease/putative transposase [Holosporaceae bacterium]